MSKVKYTVTKIPSLLVLLMHTFFRDQGVVNAAALTYTTLFAIVPLMTVSYAMFAVIPAFQGVVSQMEGWIFQNFIPATGSQIQGYLAGFASQARSLTLLGLVVLFVTALLMIKNIEAAFNRIWHIKTGRRGLSSFLSYWALLTLGPLLVGAGIGLSSYLIGLAQLDRLYQISSFQFLSLLPWVMTATGFTLIYAIVPNCRVPWRAALISGVMAALVFELAKRVFAFFVSNFPSYELIYGAFAAVPLFLIWIYICWSIILLGAVLSRILSGHSTLEVEQTPRLSVMLDILEKLAQCQRSGDAISPNRLQADLTSLGEQSATDYLALLKPLNIIANDEQGRYFVSRNLGQVKLADVAELFPKTVWVEGSESDWKRYLAAKQEDVSSAERPILELSLQQLFDISTSAETESKSDAESV